MKVSKNGIQVMHHFEGLRLLAYPDPASALFKACQRLGIDPFNLTALPAGMSEMAGAPWTVGRGDTGSAWLGLKITEAEADDRFNKRLATEFEPMAARALRLVISQGAFDGFVSGVYNVGPGQKGKRDGLIVLANGQPSTVLRRLNAGDERGAANALLAWDKAGGASMLGLRRRRAAERALMLGSTGAEAIAIGKAAR